MEDFFSSESHTVNLSELKITGRALTADSGPIIAIVVIIIILILLVLFLFVMTYLRRRDEVKAKVVKDGKE